MKKGLYPRLAFDGIRKNRRLYLPYILTCVGMTAMFYIVNYFQFSKTVSEMPGGETVQTTISIGISVLMLFSAIFLFYTNSFLIRRRKKEFGLYNILGMSKRNLCSLVIWETLIIALISLSAGVIFGIIFSKLAELILAYILSAETSYSFEISSQSVILTLAVFLGIFIVIMLNSLRQVQFSTAISLLKSENVGEKPPKANPFFGLLGIALLAAAYFIAVSIRDPLVAMVVFFLAVAMVITGTYLTMISGSVMMCRILQKNKRYYYKPNHFVSVSSMVYRMKRNGAGLASICILATMVLVMISSTASLYFGTENSLMQRYPREYNMNFYMNDFDGLSDENLENIRGVVAETLGEYGGTVQNVIDFRTATTAGFLDMSEGTVETNVGYFNLYDTGSLDNGIFLFYFVSLDDYNRMYNANETLNSGEALAYVFRNSYDRGEISFNRGETLKIIKQVPEFQVPGEGVASSSASMVLIVPDIEAAIGALANEADFNGDRIINPTWYYGFDTGFSEDEQLNITASFWNSFTERLPLEKSGAYTRGFDGRTVDRQSFYSLYGGLFFLGILLSIVFVFAAVLIIYYKQISEGYEDRSRFEIMQKVGMTAKEIRKNINSQLLTVFFLPLVFAAVHLTFAFPIIKKILLPFGLNNYVLFTAVTIICFAVFAGLYTLVYKITSNAYYNIVSGVKED